MGAGGAGVSGGKVRVAVVVIVIISGELRLHGWLRFWTSFDLLLLRGEPV